MVNRIDSKGRPGGVDVWQASRDFAEGNAFLLDVRSPGEFADGHAPGAVCIPLGDLSRRAGELPADQPVYVLCRSGNRSSLAARDLAGLGFDVANVEGGMIAWEAASLPVERSGGRTTAGLWSLFSRRG